MRILFISNLYPPIYVGGYEQICFDVARGLEGRGHVVAVLTSDFRAEEVGIEERNVFRRLKLKKGWLRPPGAAQPGETLDTLRVQRHNVRLARRVVATWRPDVVMVWNGAHLGHGLLSALEQRARVAYYLSDPWLAGLLALQRMGKRTPLRLRLYGALLRIIGVPTGGIRDRCLVFCSSALRRQYGDLGAEVSGGTIIYHGVSTGVFPFRPPHILRRAPGDPHRILYAGQIVPHKGVSTLVRALGKLRSAGSPVADVRLGLLGSVAGEDYRLELQGLIEQLGLGSVIDFLPRRPRNEVGAVYGDYDVLAFTSEWQEPFSVALLEAMASGIPIVSSLTGGTAEIIRDGENAIAFQAGDPDDLAGKLRWALTHPREVAAMAQRAAEQVATEYSLDAEVSAIEAYLLSLTRRPA